MPWQLIFTSSPRTLTAGQSGYGTVARSRDLRDALVQRLEQLSYYPHWTAGASDSAQPPVLAYRIVDLRGAKYHVLSRIQDAGLDFTHRTNHLAHHLIFSPEELSQLPSPAIIFQKWNGWRSAWSEEPRWLDQKDLGNLFQVRSHVLLPARNWQAVTGDAGSAAALVEQPLAAGCFLLRGCAGDGQLLDLFAESLQLLDPEGKSSANQWQFPFTTCLQIPDDPTDFRWRACANSSPALAKVQHSPGVSTLALDQVSPTASPLATIARQGVPRPRSSPAAPSRPTAASPSQAPLKLHRQTGGAFTPTPTAPQLRRPIPASHTRHDSMPSSMAGERRNASPRLVVPISVVAALLLAGIACFVWPGWLAAPKTKSVPQNTSQASSSTIADPLAKSSVTPQEPVSALPQPPKPAHHPPPDSPPPPAQALASMEQQIDRIPSFVVIAGASPYSELPRIRELEDLVNRLLPRGNEAPLSLDAMEGRVSSEQFLLSLEEKSMRLRARKDAAEKILVLESERAPEFQISFKDWWFDPAKPMLVQRLSPQPDSAVLLVHPSKPGLPVRTFRLIVCDLNRPPAPLWLSKTLLRANQPDFTNSLAPALRARLAGIQWPAALLLQLRPFIGPDPKDLHDALLSDPPAPGGELNFDAARANLAGKIAKAKKELEKLNSQAAELKSAIAKANDEDIELGRKLGREGSLSSLKAFAGSQNVEPSQDLFRVYLKLVFQGKFKEDVLAKFDHPAQAHALMENLPQLMASARMPAVAGDYFVNRWKSLALMNALAKKNDERNQMQSKLESLVSSHRMVPADLAGVSQVRLYLTDKNNRRLLELMRFSDAPTSTP